MTDLETGDVAESLDIAVIGLTGRFPGAKNLDEFWLNLRNGVEAISFFTDQEVEASGVDPAEFCNPHYVKAGGVLEDAEMFDASFFGFYPREAEIIDPQQRIFLECAREALENAGYDPETYQGLIGVWAGAGMNTYLLHHLLSNRKVAGSVHSYHLTIGNDKDFLTTRVSYKLNLRGPSVNVQSACSTSLVAVHMACQGLLTYQCDIALAGGISIRLPQRSGYLYQEGGIASPDGHCWPFDAKAQGTVSSNGVGIVVLKRLADAIADGDYIHAVIKGTAINNDGSLKVGYTAPSIDGQEEVIALAQALARVEPDTISYIEAHGTGTALGDPIEITALTRVFRAKTQAKSFCAIGSVKSNIGHLDAAAGVAGLIKTILALKHKLIPPSLHFERPNPKIDFANSPFYVNTRLSEWKTNGIPRRAGVSSFGLGGTNAHVIVEEAPATEAAGSYRPWHLLPLSAKTDSALERGTTNLAAHLKQHPELNLADVAYTYQVGRHPFNHRRMVVCQSLEDATNALESLDPKRVFTAASEPGERPIVFMFSGQGSQYVNMAQELYQVEPTFRAQVDCCSEFLQSHLGLDLRELLFPSEERAKQASQQLAQTFITQPALFVIEYALARLWMEWGVRPSAMIGHSIGEYVAACLAGVFSLEDALALVATRGRLMQNLPGGAMLSISSGESEARQLLNGNLSLATINAPSLCVVSGREEAVDEFADQLAKKAVAHRRLRTSHAFHSEMMGPILEPFTDCVAQLSLNPPAIPFISNVTGTWITAEEATDPSYWARQLRRTVRFADGVGVLLQEPSHILLEVGPGQTLSALAKQHPDCSRERAVFSSLRHPHDPQPDLAFLLNTLGKLWLAGARIDWPGFHTHEKRCRLPLPTYPFERQRYWVEPDGQRHEVGAAQIQLRKHPDIADWLYVPSWKRLNLPRTLGTDSLASDRRCWLIFSDESRLGSSMVERLEQKNQDVIKVQIGKQFGQVNSSTYAINPREQGDYHALLKQLKLSGKVPDKIVHLWSATPHDQGQSSIEAFDEAQDLGFYSLLFLVQAIERQQLTSPIHLGVVTTNVKEVIGEEELCPAKATILGLCKVIPQEYPNITCQSIDLVLPEPGNPQRSKLIDELIRELTEGSSNLVIAYRGNHRWVQTFEPLPWDRPSAGARLRKEGVYLITGGLGRTGLVLAQDLARTVQAKLALVGHSAFPTRDEWEQWLATHSEQDAVSRKIRQLRASEELGSEILILHADVTSREQMREAIARTEERFGALHGVIYTAGLVGERSIKTIQETGRAECKAHFDSKARGLMVLAEVLQGREFDFCLLQSSLSSILGGLGLAAYAAANSLMDTFALKYNQTSSTPWISVNWDGWRFDEPQNAVHGPTIAELAIMPEEGAQVFQRILSLGEVPQLVISTGDLQARIAQWLKSKSLPELESAETESASSYHARPDLQTSYAAPRNELEKAIVELWQKILGIEQIGIHDSFFELGGHSLLATQMVSRLRDSFQMELPLRRLFEMPTVAELAALIAAARGAESEPPTPAISRVPRDGELPLSFAQQRLWFLDQLEPGSPVYNNPAAVRLAGSLNVKALEQSLNEIVRRHEILRTIYSAAEGRPKQIVLPELLLPLPVIDLSQAPERERDAEVARLAAEEVRRPFDLTQGPLLRITLLRISEAGHIALLTMHHIVSDGWSIGVLIRELATLYETFSAGKPSPLLELPIQYADFAHWHRQWLQGELLEKQLAYWKQQLSDGPLILDLPTDRPKPALQSFQGATQWFKLSRQLSKALEELSQQEEVTLFMLLVAAFQTLLYRYTGQEDICIGTPIAGRNWAETEGLIGCFVNTLVLRTDLSGDPSFQQLLKRVREVALGAYAHQDLPFEMLVEELQPERDLSRTPLFQVMFVHLKATPEDSQLPALTISLLETDTGTAKFDLTLFVEEGSEGLKIILNYNTDLFDYSTITRLADHFRMLLEGIIANPKQRLSALPLLTEPERQQLLVEWNETDNDQSPARPVHQLIEAQAERTPEAVALVCGAKRQSYQELNQRANQLAHYLRKRGVGPEMLVGLCVDRSLEMIVGLLGILKAGGAFLPLDPAYPEERLAFMLADAEVRVVLTQQRLIEQLRIADCGLRIEEATIRNPQSAIRNLMMLCLDTDWKTIAQEPEKNPDSQVTAENLAYVIYTSGSTGKPKGVLINHGSIAHHCRDIIQHYELTANDRVLQFASLNFDAALEQILPTLMVGARLVVRDAEIWTGRDLQQQISDEGLTIVNLPPAYWHQWIQEWANGKEPPAPEQLRLVIVGGDAISSESLNVWQQLPLSSVRLLNAYGPTETTITATTYEIPGQSQSSEALKRIPIGRPLANRRAYILDKHGSPVPIGVPGELHLGGAGVARGYLRRPELTAEKFLPDPFRRWQKGDSAICHPPSATASGAQLYKTGDLARYLLDGNIEFLGRADHQVKIRGFRIELGEIEAVLRQHAAVSETAVVARGDRPGDKRLVAYYVPATETAPTSSELRGYLQEKLPEYMVPSALVAIAALPLTPSGKLDRRALPTPDAERTELETIYTAPRTPTEETLVEIWAQVIGVERVGIHHNFFELGGHSLLATQLISRVRSEFRVELPLRRLFEYPTVAGLSLIISQQLAAQEDAEEMEQLLAELEQLSDGEAQRLLVEQMD